MLYLRPFARLDRLLGLVVAMGTTLERRPMSVPMLAAKSAVDDVLTRDVVLVDAAIAYKPGRDGVDHGWSKAAVKLKMVPLDSCPSDFTSAFADYTVAVDKYGSFLEDRTGVSLIDDILDLDSDKKLRRLVDSINTSYASLEAAAMSLGVEAKRGSISLE